MPERISDDDARALFEALNPYQVAVMSFTSPNEVSANAERVCLMSKDAYMWAGAVAYIVSRHPEVTAEEMLRFLRDATRRRGYPDRAVGSRLGYRYGDAVDQHVRSFLRAAGFDEGFDEACARADDAMRSLEWLGVIQDPTKKKIAGIVLSVYAAFGPVNFTAAGPNDFSYMTPTWQLSAKPEKSETRFTFNLRVQKIASLIMGELLPSYDKISEDAQPSESTTDAISTEALQKRLAELGYYKGRIDGKPRAQTYKALVQFQTDRSLAPTGHPDPATVRALREARRW
jgi:hypothetical protein